MLAPFKWIKDYVEIEGSCEALAEQMIMTGNGVEEIEDLSNTIKNVVVGKILQIEKHPDADKLQICKIDVGSEVLDIVTGADNVFEGALVPVALIGAKLPNGLSIKKGKLRGVLSYGMLCSGEELQITDNDYPGASVYGILILKEAYQPGTDINEVLMQNDQVINFEVGANRPDCLSMLGIAREAAAAVSKPISIPKTPFHENAKHAEDFITVEVKDSDLCPRYMARVVENVTIAPSPKWMQERLKAAGIRPINNIVDITNFVMLETGQPMHAFDYDEIRGKKIIVRRAEVGEKMVTLDGKLREMTTSMLMIADAEGPIGIAGIMGGENSEIKDSTKTIVFESAKFMYGNIRQTSRGLGIATEASMRFSKGVDAFGAEYAINRASSLVEELKAGEIVSGAIDICTEDLSQKTISVTASRINALLGMQLSVEQMVSCLNRVFIEVSVEGETLTCTIPHFRDDIEGSADIAEEVARIYGYDNIPATMPLGSTPDLVNKSLLIIDELKRYIVNLGFYECITYSFTGKADWDKLALQENDPLRNAVRIRNPLGDDSGYMRTTLSANMLSVLSLNLKRKIKAARLFEIGKVFIKQEGEKLPKEYTTIALAGNGDMDFYDMKGYVENVLELLPIEGKVSFVAGGASYFHPGRSAEILINGEKIGELGEIHPDVAKNFGINGRAYLAEMKLELILKFITDKIKKYITLPKYPAIERDIALILPEEIPAADVLDEILAHGGSYMEKADLFDVYQGDNMEKGKKSLAYSLVFRSKEGTLKDEDIQKDMENILAAVKAKFGAMLRES